ncbi:hypothetical protein BDDG_13539 [Blastomyces dermatitidis ATCC 18188]|uniref:Uncharacterized protein n=1 Tax=Ajellomyces dermatitidis (strain ATCC 18188 / CBS 674.68) TaxID=653446 RepID=A0A0J9ESY2_AJEDA|nr:hypothetical protein BDDG_13539 [Blastomyces dermatitidis ATCC 18188]
MTLTQSWMEPSKKDLRQKEKVRLVRGKKNKKGGKRKWGEREREGVRPIYGPIHNQPPFRQYRIIIIPPLKPDRTGPSNAPCSKRAHVVFSVAAG